MAAELSFAFTDELLKQPSGTANASLLLSHWERLQVDPFFVPTSEEEMEEFGQDNADLPNLAH